MAVSIGKIAAGGTGASVAYYVDQVSTDSHDYYAGHGEAAGTWHGAFAESLGLSGEVTGEAMRAVLDGMDPSTGQQLKRQPNRNVAGFDVTFSPP
jgi:conjugative relaxase-like TrwC/TraI family protein